MTTNQTIDGVPRGKRALESLAKIFLNSLHHGVQPSFSIEELKYFITELFELIALLDKEVSGDSRAPLPQGEPIYQLEYLGEGGGGWNDVDKATYERFERLPNYRPRIVYAAPPQGEPVAVSTETRTPFEIEHDAEPGDEAAFRKWRAERNYQTCCGSCPGGCVIGRKP